MTPEERNAQLRTEQYQKIVDAERNVSPLNAEKLAQAQKRLAAVQAQRSAFDSSPLAAQYAREPESWASKNKKWLLIGAVGAAGFYAWRKWGK